MRWRAAWAGVLLLACSCGKTPAPKPGLEQLDVRPTTGVAPTPEPGVTPGPLNEFIPGTTVVSFQAADGTKLVGRVFGFGRGTAVLIIPGDTMASGFELARRLAREGYAALSLDLRGTGQSQGAVDPPKTVSDIAEASSFLRNTGSAMRAVVTRGEAGVAALATPRLAAVAALDAPMTPAAREGIRTFNSKVFTTSPDVAAAVPKDRLTKADPGSLADERLLTELTNFITRTVRP